MVTSCLHHEVPVHSHLAHDAHDINEVVFDHVLEQAIENDEGARAANSSTDGISKVCHQ